VRLEQQRRIEVTLEPCAEGLTAAPSEEQLRAFLVRPLRPLRGLLDPARLQAAPGDRYLYRSRPYGVAGWTLQPQVTLEARWDGEQLRIRQLEARVDGLGDWQDRLDFGLEATIRPLAPEEALEAVLEAEARLWAEVPAAAAPLAAPVLRLALQQLLDRLERRCQRGLRRRAEAWLSRPAQAA
jgi:hypothetical protein